MASKNFEDFNEDFDELIEAEGGSPEDMEEPTEEEPVEQVAPKRVPPIPPRPTPPAPKKVAPAPAPARRPAPKQQQEEPQGEYDEESIAKPPTLMLRREPKPKAQAPAPAIETRYAPYIRNKSYGLMDNLTGQAVETAEMESLTLTLLSNILNKLDKIESSL